MQNLAGFHCESNLLYIGMVALENESRRGRLRAEARIEVVKVKVADGGHTIAESSILSRRWTISTTN